MNAKCAKITYLMVINALLVSTCLGAGSINDQGMKIRDANPSLEHSGAAATSQHAKLSRKLLAPKAWTTLWADEFDSWDSTKWSYHFGDGCQINLCGWGNNELVCIPSIFICTAYVIHAHHFHFFSIPLVEFSIYALYHRPPFITMLVLLQCRNITPAVLITSASLVERLQSKPRKSLEPNKQQYSKTVGMSVAVGVCHRGM